MRTCGDRVQVGPDFGIEYPTGVDSHYRSLFSHQIGDIDAAQEIENCEVQIRSSKATELCDRTMAEGEKGAERSIHGRTYKKLENSSIRPLRTNKCLD